MPQGDPGTILTAANEPVWNSNTDLFFNILNTGILYIWLFVIHVRGFGSHGDNLLATLMELSNGYNCYGHQMALY